MRKINFLLAVLLLSVAVRGQGPIEDNSFLIEEAYNQEKGVIQYISAFYRERNGNFGYSFTNEIPVKGQKNQFSYTVNINRSDGTTRLGDTYINYRYQALGWKDGDKVAVSPRLSLILPTGSYRHETGSGAVGFQANLPVSVTLSKKFVTHWNAGTTIIPRARNSSGERANTKGFNLGQSTVFLASNKFNILMETVWNRNENVIGKDRVKSEYSLLLNPGIRWAWNLKNGFQVVPGIAVPLGVGPSRGERGIFLYLSFER